MQQDAFRILKKLHLAILLGFILFAGVIIVLFETGQLVAIDPSIERTLQVVAVVVSVAATLIGFNLFKRGILQARNSKGSGEVRMGLYRGACIRWWAMLEGPGLLAVIGFFITGNYAFIALAGLHILILILFRPRKENIIVLLNLNSQEVDRLEGHS
jgi:protein-S-isoprenylcysteine O-methyltransferase Ste14